MNLKQERESVFEKKQEIRRRIKAQMICKSPLLCQPLIHLPTRSITSQTVALISSSPPLRMRSRFFNISSTSANIFNFRMHSHSDTAPTTFPQGPLSSDTILSFLSLQTVKKVKSRFPKHKNQKRRHYDHYYASLVIDASEVIIPKASEVQSDPLLILS